MHDLDVDRKPERKSDVLAKADAAWMEWQRFLDREVSSERAESQGTDGWTLAEAVAHVARWQQWSLPHVAELATGGRVVDVDVDKINGEWAEQDREISYDEAARRLDEAWAAFRAAAASVPDEGWSRRLTALVKANTWEHYEEHMSWRPDQGAARESPPARA